METIQGPTRPLTHSCSVFIFMYIGGCSWIIGGENMHKEACMNMCEGWKQLHCIHPHRETVCLFFITLHNNKKINSLMFFLFYHTFGEPPRHFSLSQKVLLKSSSHNKDKHAIFIFMFAGMSHGGKTDISHKHALRYWVLFCQLCRLERSYVDNKEHNVILILIMHY